MIAKGRGRWAVSQIPKLVPSFTERSCAAPTLKVDRSSQCEPVFGHCGSKYRIYWINRPRRLLKFWTLRVGAYSRWALIRGWALIKFSPFLGSEVC